MDEAGRIGIPNLPEHASTVVGRKISLSMSAQSRSQFNPTLTAASTFEPVR
jgi:TraM recognition site of TraD and TraG